MGGGWVTWVRNAVARGEIYELSKSCWGRRGSELAGRYNDLQETGGGGREALELRAAREQVRANAEEAGKCGVAPHLSVRAHAL